MTDASRISDLDLAALLCSRVCHDVISPVGAIANGLELFDDPEMDEETKATALDMIRSSARTAGAKLKFCRIAFGAAGTAGALIDLSEAGEVARGFRGRGKGQTGLAGAAREPAQAAGKLLLNMLLLAIAGIPRGGSCDGGCRGRTLTVRASGERAKISEPLAEVLAGTADLSCSMPGWCSPITQNSWLLPLASN